MGDNILDVISENSPLVERQIEKAASLLEYMPGAALNPIIGTGPTPIYTPREIEKLALCDDPQYNKYGVEPTNQELAVRFKDSFATLYSGIMPDIIDELRDDWVDAVYKEQEQLGGEDDKIHRQNIVALGWHPDFNILEADWATLNKNTLKKIMEEYQYDGSSVIDICEFVKLTNDKSSKKVKEKPKDPNEKNLNPIFITLVGGRSDSIPSSLIKWWTKGPFCHAAIGFRHTLDDMKSFNTSKFNGLSDEDLKFYSPEEKLAVYTIFVEDEDMKSIKKEIDYYVDNRDKTRYSRLNIASIVFNVPLNFQFDMVCSQFVDRVLKFAKIDLTGKDSSLVSPNDFWKASKNNKKMYKVYDGKVGDYKPNKVKAALDRLLHSKKTKTIKECVENILYHQEGDIMSINESQKFNSSTELYKYLNDNFDYGLVVNNQATKFNSNNLDDYRTLSPSKFDKFKIGVCWDYAEFEYINLKKLGLKPDVYYIEAIDKDGDHPTHTWCSFEEDGKTKVMEVSWGKFRGIHEYKNTQDMLKSYIDEWLKSIKFENSPIYVVHKIDQVGIYNLTYMKYMAKARSKSCIKKVGNFVAPVYESYKDYIDYVPLYPVLETKEFPVQFDEDGNLIIKNYKKLDYNKEYQLSHQSLKAYAKAKQYEGIKYELSKLWFINTLIMVKIHDNKIEEDEKAELTKIRAWIMNDYTTYLKMITDNDPSFNFSKYYEDSPFSDVRIKINSHTIRGVADLIKYAVK